MPNSASFLSIWLMVQLSSHWSGQKIGRLPAGKEGIEIVGGPHAHRDARAPGGAAQMRQQKHVVEPAVSRIDTRLVAEYVEAGSSKLARGQSCDQRIVVDDVATGRIHDDGAVR